MNKDAIMAAADAYASEQSLYDSLEFPGTADLTDQRDARAALLSLLTEVEQDAARLDWLRDNLFTHKWNGVVGSGCAVQWRVAPDYLFKQRELTENSGIMAGDFRRAIDRAMQPEGTTP